MSSQPVACISHMRSIMCWRHFYDFFVFQVIYESIYFICDALVLFFDLANMCTALNSFVVPLLLSRQPMCNIGFVIDDMGTFKGIGCIAK